MITTERENELLFHWLAETPEAWSRKWRKELDAEESALVEQWDYGFCDSLRKMYQDLAQQGG